MHTALKYAGLTLLLCLFSALLYSQSAGLSGKVADTTGTPLANATVKVKWGTDSLFRFTDKNGDFSISQVNSVRITLEVSMVGFTPFVKSYDLRKSGVTNAGSIRLEEVASELDGVVITATTPVKVMEDTVQYSVAAFKVREGAPAEDVIKKLPGVTVDKDGNITSQGKPVARIRVNGKDFFGGDVQTATQNLPADILDNIQIIEDYGDEASLTGVKTGEPETIININIKKDKKRGYFGNASLAGGTKERYVAGGMVNLFRDETQVSVLASVNNTNTNTFNFNGGGRGGGARGANFGGDDRGRSSNGLTDTKSGGLNYRDRWGEKISVNGSYSFSDRNTDVVSATQSQDINPQNIRFTNSNRTNRSHSQNHRLTFNLEYRIDSVNFLKVSPYLSLSSSDNSSESISTISRSQYSTWKNSRSNNSSYAPNAGTNLMYNRRLGKKGRNFNLTGRLEYSDRSQENNSFNNYRNVDSAYLPPALSDTIQRQLSEIASHNTTTNVRVSYTEPLGNSTAHFVEASYEFNRSATGNNRNVFDLDQTGISPELNETQSNNFNYQFITNRYGLRLKGRNKKYNYAVGIISQPSILSGQSVGKNISTHYTNTNWIPSARFVYNLGKNHTLTATYDGNSREPNFMQLQPVADSSNLNSVVVGNPNLRAEFSSAIRVRYNKFDRATGRSIFGNLSYDKTNDKIVASRYNNAMGTGRTTTYINTDGFYRLNGNGSVTQTFADRKYSGTLSFSASYDNNISYTDNQRNKGRNWNLRPGAVFRLDIDNVVDLNLNGNYTFYKTTTQYTTYTNTNEAKTLQVGLGGKNYFFKDFTIGYDLAKTFNNGFGSNVNSNPFIVNLYAEYRFLKGKKATIRLQGFDLLNENTGISRTINETTITDNQSNRLSRYALLSFNMRIQKFGGGVKRMPGNRTGNDKGQRTRDN